MMEHLRYQPSETASRARIIRNGLGPMIFDGELETTVYGLVHDKYLKHVKIIGEYTVSSSTLGNCLQVSSF